MKVAFMENKDLFLQQNLKGEFRVEPLAYGLSFRTYDRVYMDDNTFVLMNVPVDGPLEDGQSAIDGVIRPFLHVHEYLNALGVKVPEVYHVDESLGKVLLEDFGNDTFYDLFSEVAVNEELYTKAVDTLVTLYKASSLENVDEYNADLARVRGTFFLDDYLPAVTGVESTPAQYDELHQILTNLYDVVAGVKWGTVLWDYHSPNLMEIDSGVGVLDFQDAKYGPLSYDLASLLYDARFTFPENIREKLFNHFVKQCEIKDVQSFKDSFEMAGLLRNLGVLGRFARAYYRDGKPEMLPKIQVLWPYIDEALQNPKAATLKSFLDKNMPTKKLLTA